MSHTFASIHCKVGPNTKSAKRVSFKTHIKSPYFRTFFSVFYYIYLFQDDLHIVDSLEIPTDDPKFMEDLVELRNWGPSVLLVDV